MAEAKLTGECWIGDITKRPGNPQRHVTEQECKEAGGVVWIPDNKPDAGEQTRLRGRRHSRGGHPRIKGLTSPCSELHPASWLW
jgi:hypothetical protein